MLSSAAALLGELFEHSARVECIANGMLLGHGQPLLAISHMLLALDFIHVDDLRGLPQIFLLRIR